MWMTPRFWALAQAGPRWLDAVSLRGHGGSEGHDAIDLHSVADYGGRACRHHRLWALAAMPAPLLVIRWGLWPRNICSGVRHPGWPWLSGCPRAVVVQFHLCLSKPDLFMELNCILPGGNHTHTLVLGPFAGGG